MKLPTFVKHMRTWGEDGVVDIKSITSPKLKEKGVTCLFLDMLKITTETFVEYGTQYGIVFMLMQM